MKPAQESFSEALKELAALKAAQGLSFVCVEFADHSHKGGLNEFAAYTPEGTRLSSVQRIFSDVRPSRVV